MKTIWKFPLSLDHLVDLKMPAGAEVLTIQLQGDRPTLWAIVDPEATPVTRRFTVAGTGHRLSETRGRYIGTWQQDGYVWHLFQETP